MGENITPYHTEQHSEVLQDKLIFIFGRFKIKTQLGALHTGKNLTKHHQNNENIQQKNEVIPQAEHPIIDFVKISQIENIINEVGAWLNQ